MTGAHRHSQIRGLKTFLPELVLIFLISVSQVTRITGVSHCTWPSFHGTLVWTQSLMFARQMLYHLNHAPSLSFALVVFV
jgi:hypothetical protein